MTTIHSTSRLNLPLLMPAQALKYITHNEALAALDVLVQLTLSGAVNRPPDNPNEGDVVRVSGPAEEGFLMHLGDIAVYLNGAWSFIPPQEGWRAFNLETGSYEVFYQGAWKENFYPSIISVEHLGVGTASDSSLAINAFGEASLLRGPAGHQLKLDRPTETDTVSVLFSTNFQGAGEIGLAGSDGFTIKSSDDGQTFEIALEFNAGGVVNAPQGLKRNGFEVWDTGNAPDLLFGRGVISNGTDLNDLTLQGVYTQSSNFGATTGQNYPRELAGTLTVRETAFGVQQDYRLYGGAPNDEGDAIFIRSFYGGSWRLWKKIQTSLA